MIRVPLVNGRRNIISFQESGIIYNFDTQWNNRLQLYQADIYENGVLVLAGCMLVVGINVIEGLTGINIINLYCIKVGFPSSEIGFEDLGDAGFVVIDDQWEIKTAEDIYYASLTENVYIPVNIIKDNQLIDTVGGDTLQDTDLDFLLTSGKY